MTNDRLNVKFYYPEILNYAMVQSQKTEPASLDISSPEELHDVAIVIGGESITEVRTPVSMIPAGNTVTFRDIRITPDAARLRRATESVSEMIHLAIVQHAGSESPETVFKEDYPVRLLAFNEWPGDHVRRSSQPYRRGPARYSKGLPATRRLTGTRPRTPTG